LLKRALWALGALLAVVGATSLLHTAIGQPSKHRTAGRAGATPEHPPQTDAEFRANLPARVRPEPLELANSRGAPTATMQPTATTQRLPDAAEVAAEEAQEFVRKVRERAERTASQVHTLRDLDGVLTEIDRDIEKQQRVTAFHAQTGMAAVRAAYRDAPEEELDARLLELDHRLAALSARYDPAIREGVAQGAAAAAQRKLN
jgi:hypothetical protein